MDLNKFSEDKDGNLSFTMLTKDKKPICLVTYSASIFTIPDELEIKDILPASYYPLSQLHSIFFWKAAQTIDQSKEWERFLHYLIKKDRVAIGTCGYYEILIPPPRGKDQMHLDRISVCYRVKTPPISQGTRVRSYGRHEEINEGIDVCSQSARPAVTRCKKLSPRYKEDKLDSSMVIHPDFLVSLSQNHAGWIFGGLAELIDNSRDAKATQLDISIQMEYFNKVGQRIPVLGVTDNGHGMSHSDIQRMLTLGHELPKTDDKDIIGRFGVGFKAGSMRLGKDVVVLTQCSESRSIGFLSCSLNERKKNMEVPIITYRREGGWMEFETAVHSVDEAERYLKAVKEYSPFNEYSIGTKFAKFEDSGSGTQIYIYNLAKWGSSYALDWDEKDGEDAAARKKRDIWVRTKRVRMRNGQTSKEVPLDYSLHSYLEVIFLEPRMKIFVQDTMVKTRRLAKSLNKTKVLRDTLLGKTIEITLGRSIDEMARGNCGIFLYWHGRLVEAYKRVGHMVHSADMGRGIIGVIDVTEVMTGDNSLILNNKQGFSDSEVYAKLEEWLGIKTDEYWDTYFDSLDVRNHCENLQPDHEWVQCNKCWKWRILDPGFNSDYLPDEWFCYMHPFNGSCNIPEQETQAGIVTVGARRSHGGLNVTNQNQPIITEGDDDSTTEIEDEMGLVISDNSLRKHKRDAPRRLSERISSKIRSK